ncbi:plasmid pRiA4b ORF-3 family protein [Pseudaminobacter arsenicus]|uniref:Plasmid pRiA4b ORF-3 family protein n=1 Tax=Borborobacter arsenicus TaxID=1851146 RepID=A0A432V2A5_9HYPH|nr:plasmid pRiA4b ORF-3 family protein [Pseudaminobacter arsenicus]RUM96333.1 plasmid pRiA4b ORF-3 family protein [Pseudaminobacter arsenicus]
MFKAINAVQIHASLDEIEPEVWRRLVLPANWNLEQLHLAIQAAFNWWNYHLHEFRIGGLRYGDIELLTEDAFDDDPRVFSFRDVHLRDFEQGATFSYLYDFGDSWRHTILVEGRDRCEPNAPSCLRLRSESQAFLTQAVTRRLLQTARPGCRDGVPCRRDCQ